MSDSRFVPPAVNDTLGGARIGPALCALVREGLRRQGRVCLRLRGDSMWPTVPDGSLVVVERVAPEAIRLGDVVVWQRSGELIAHRVVQRVHNGSMVWLTTKGDNCAVADRGLASSAVLGRLSAVYRRDGLDQVRGDWIGRLGAAFWVSRWRLRALAGAAGRFLPAGMRRPLVQFRNWMGRCLSLGFSLALLRY